MANKIPNLPPLSSISDPSTRAYLQALRDAWDVRNGTVGDGQEKFLTVGELHQVFEKGLAQPRADKAGGSVFPGGGPGPVGRIVDALAGLYRRMVDDIMQSWVYQNLVTKIEHMEIPHWFRAEVGASIKTEKEERLEQGRAIAKKMDTALARVDDSIAGVRTEIQAVATANEAVSQKVDTAVTQMDGKYALVESRIQAVSTKTNAVANQVTGLQTTVAGNTAMAEQAMTLAQDINGKVQAQWTVKLQANGHFAGFTLGLDSSAGVTQSAFIVRADTFAIFNPGENVERQPFIYHDGKAWMNGAFIRDATIKSAMIESIAADKIDTRGLLVRDYQGNVILGSGHQLDGRTYIKALSVDTLSIAGNAVTIPTTVTGQPMIGLPIVPDAEANTADLSRFAKVATIVVDLGSIAASTVFLTGCVEGALLGGPASLHVVLARDGRRLWLNSVSVQGNFAGQCVISATDASPGVGFATYNMYAAASGAQMTARRISLCGVSTKR